MEKILAARIPAKRCKRAVSSVWLTSVEPIIGNGQVFPWHRTYQDRQTNRVSRKARNEFAIGEFYVP